MLEYIEDRFNDCIIVKKRGEDAVIIFNKYKRISIRWSYDLGPSDLMEISKKYKAFKDDHPVTFDDNPARSSGDINILKGGRKVGNFDMQKLPKFHVRWQSEFTARDLAHIALKLTHVRSDSYKFCLRNKEYKRACRAFCKEWGVRIEDMPKLIGSNSI